MEVLQEGQKNGAFSNSEQARQTRLLSDLPTTDDAFGGHTRVAQAVAELTNAEEGGKAIALVGPYGSGKSTVVHILASKLKEQKRKGEKVPKVFIFDAWAHHGDPLRRSFIEELVRFLVREKWATKTQWNKVIATLSGRVENVKTTTEPHLTWPGRLVALSALLLPVGYMLFSKFGESSVWIFGAIIILLPVLIAIATWVAWRPWKRLKEFWRQEKMREFFTKHRPPHENDSVFNLFVQKKRETIKTTTIRTIDPTTIEFQDIFQRILEKTLSNRERELFIVVDNLDRLPHEEAIAAWSTMRTFFERDFREPPAWSKQFWLLVPFTPEGLSQVWDETESDDNTEPERSLRVFIDKTFQATFRVAPPIASDWKTFFMDQLQEAFPEHNKEELNPLYRLYRSLRDAKDAPPTPRAIKLFINKVVSLYLQWGEEISLPLQAVYALIEGSLSREGIEKLRDGSLLEASDLAVLEEPKWQTFLAALHFKVSPEKGLQVLLGPRIERALAKGDSPALQEIQDVPGFWDLVEHEAAGNLKHWRGEGRVELAAAARALHDLNMPPDVRARLSYEATWKHVWQSAQDVQSWDPMTEELGEGVTKILEHASQDIYKPLAKKTLQVLSKPKITELGPAEYWVSGVLPVVREIHNAGEHEMLNKVLRVPGGAIRFIEVMTLLASADVDDTLVQYFRPSQPEADIVGAFVKVVESGEMGEAETQAIRLMCRVQSGWSWNSLTDALNKRLDWNVGKNPDEIRGTIQSLFTLKYDCAHDLAGTRLKANADNGNLMDHLHHAQTNNDEIAVALCILTMLLYNPKAEGNQTQGNASSGLGRFQSVANSPQSYKQIVAEIVEIILDRNLVETLFENTRDVTNVDAIVSEILHRIADRDRLGLSPDTVIDHYTRIESAIGEDGIRKLLGHLTKEEGLIENLIERGFSTDLADFYDLTFRTCPPEKQGAFTKFLIDELQDISEEVWLQALQGESELLKLLNSLVEGNKPPRLTTNFADALRKHAEEMRVQSKASDYMREWGGVLLKALTEPDRETWLSNLRDDLMSHGQEEIESVLSVYGDDLIESGVLEETKDTADRTVRGLLEPIVIRQRPSELQWLHNALKARSGLLKKSKTSSKRALRERIKKQLEEADEEVSKLLEQIADIVKSSK